MADSPEALAYEAATNAVREQRDRVKDLRSRAGLLLTAASIVTAFLGAEALKDTKVVKGISSPVADRSLQCAELVAIGGFIVVGLCALLILWPWRNWYFRFSGYDLIRDYVDPKPQPKLESVQRDLTLHLEADYKKNEQKLWWLFRAFQVGALALAIEVVAWLIDLT